MTTYEPGTVAVATVRGVPNVRVMRSGGCDGWGWVTADKVETWRVHEDRLVYDIRPLVVLDTSVPNSGRAIGVWVRECAEYLRGNGQTAKARVLAGLADQIEAQTKPPRIPEPGLWGVVQATVAYEGSTYDARFVNHDGANAAHKSWHDAGGKWWNWSELIDPVLIREGVES